MAKFEALDELLDDCLELPVRGKLYRIDSPCAEDGIRVERITSMAMQLVAGGEPDEREVLDDDEERDFYQLCLGPVYDEMLDDGVSWVWLRHSALTAMIWINSGTEAAKRHWSAAGDPEKLAPNREARRNSGSDAAKSTPRRGSTNGTNRHRGGRRPQQARQK